MSNYALPAEKRDRAGKGVARALRRENKIPAVIYGDNKDPLNISIPSNDINVEYNKGQMATTLCDLDVGGEKHLVLARDIQLHPVTDVVVHADFLRVTKKTQIPVMIPVQFTNEDKSPGLEDGGILNVVRYEVELMCSAMDIPEFIELDLTGAEQGDALKMSNAKLPEGTRPVIDDRDFAIANIQAPKSLEQLEAELAAEEEGDAEGEEGAEGEEAAEGADGEAAEGGEESAEGGEEAKEE